MSTRTYPQLGACNEARSAFGVSKLTPLTGSRREDEGRWNSHVYTEDECTYYLGHVLHAVSSPTSVQLAVSTTRVMILLR